MIGNGFGNEGESGDGQLIEQIIDTSQPGPTTILVITVYSIPPMEIFLVHFPWYFSTLFHAKGS